MVHDLRQPLDPDPVPSEWWLERMRLRRNALLAAADYTQLVDDPTGTAAQWADYRAELRDAPSTWEPGPDWSAPESPG
jgi:hypothetical protein